MTKQKRLRGRLVASEFLSVDFLLMQDSWLDLLSPRSWSIECVGMGLDGRRLKI